MSLEASCGSEHLACSGKLGTALCASSDDLDKKCSDLDAAKWAECKCSVFCGSGYKRRNKDAADANSEQACVSMSENKSCGNDLKDCGEEHFCATGDKVDVKCDTHDADTFETCKCAKSCEVVSPGCILSSIS